MDRPKHTGPGPGQHSARGRTRETNFPLAQSHRFFALHPGQQKPKGRLAPKNSLVWNRQTCPTQPCSPASRLLVEPGRHMEDVDLSSTHDP